MTPNRFPLSRPWLLFVAVALSAVADDTPHLHALVRLTCRHLTGTGVVVDAKGTVATTYEIAAAPGRIQVGFQMPDGRLVHPGRVDRLGFHPSKSLALLRIPDLAGIARPLSIANELPTVASTVRGVGFVEEAQRHDLKPTLHRGVIATNFSPGSWQLGLTVAEGMVGGALLNADNELVGIMDRDPHRLADVHLGVPLQRADLSAMRPLTQRQADPDRAATWLALASRDWQKQNSDYATSSALYGFVIAYLAAPNDPHNVNAIRDQLQQKQPRFSDGLLDELNRRLPSKPSK